MEDSAEAPSEKSGEDTLELELAAYQTIDLIDMTRKRGLCYYRAQWLSRRRKRAEQMIAILVRSLAVLRAR